MSKDRAPEQIYDEEIAPALLELGKKAEKLGMSMVAVVEYSPGEWADTTTLSKDAGLPIRMMYMCARTAPNVDSYMINLKRYCKGNNIDMSSSCHLSWVLVPRLPGS